MEHYFFQFLSFSSSSLLFLSREVGKVLLKFRLNKVLSKIFQTPRSVVCGRERKWTFSFPGAFKYVGL